MMLETFGWWATEEERVGLMLASDSPPWFLVTGQCSSGCHRIQEAIEDEMLPAIWPEIEYVMRKAFSRVHGGSP
jgi:hypothetical protein